MNHRIDHRKSVRRESRTQSQYFHGKSLTLPSPPLLLLDPLFSAGGGGTLLDYIETDRKRGF
jgi:hypothetical protein